jgi:putative flippase GtrA
VKRSRLTAFALVGAAGFVVDAGIMAALSIPLGMEVHLARALSFMAASASTWRLNRRYTFVCTRTDGGQFIEWLRYFWSSAAGGLVNYGAFSGVIAVFGIRGYYPVAGVAIGSLAGMAVNYTLYSRYVFRRP